MLSFVDPGMRLSELIVWYLEQIESEISSAEQLEYETLVVEKIIKRLLKTVSQRFKDMK